MSLPTPQSQFDSDILVTRVTPSVLDASTGFFSNSVSSTFLITASVQPASGEDLLIFPEGERTKEFLLLFTETELNTADQDTGQKADQVEFKNKTYEVKKVSPFLTGTTLDHYECIVAKVNA